MVEQQSAYVAGMDQTRREHVYGDRGERGGEAVQDAEGKVFDGQRHPPQELKRAENR